MSNIVIVDDEKNVLDLQQEALLAAGLNPETFTNPVDAFERIKRGDVAVLVTDWNMPQMTGMELLFKTRSIARPPYVIVMTAHGTISRAVQAMNEGAFNFLEKPFSVKNYIESVKNALERFQRSPAPEAARKSKRAATSDNEPVIHSPAMLKVLDAALSAADTDSTVLLLGESGSGKEVLADLIHRNSQRASETIVKVNCGALPEHLMESELFGHEKGAFTGAEKRNIGRFELANRGTLFLDEIGDLLLPLQVKLLRALQERTIERIGSSTPIPIDFRLICATHRNLKAAIEEKQFREDLFYRINVVPIRVPALRDRPEDIEPLAQRMFKVLRTPLPKGPESISADALGILHRYGWPGNVRQLRNAIEYALVVCRGDTIGVEDLPEDIRSEPQPSSSVGTVPLSSQPTEPIVSPAPASSGLKGSIQEAEAAAIREACKRHRWKMTEVAKDLKISRSTLYLRMAALGIKRFEDQP